MTPLYEIRIRRDASTITPIRVPEYELPILQEMFGEENIQNRDGKSIAEVGIGQPVGDFTPQGEEFERLSAKYGVDLIEAVYGKKNKKTLDKAVAEAEKTKPAK